MKRETIPTEPVAVRISRRDKATLRRIAKARGLKSVSELLRPVIEAFLGKAA